MITTNLLTYVADFINNRIVKLVLNETYEISQFDIKQTENNKVTIQYKVPSGIVSSIALIELKDSLGNVLSSNSVYIPITADTLISQSIEVKGV